MKMFILGMFITYLIIGIICMFVDAYAKYDETVLRIICFPEYICYSIFEYLYDYFKYHNVKSIIYISEQQKWFYCERNQYDNLSRTFVEPENYNEVRKQLYDMNAEDFIKFYKNPLHKEFKPVFEGTLFSNRYVPKSVWSSMPKISYTFETVQDMKNDNTTNNNIKDEEYQMTFDDILGENTYANDKNKNKEA